MKRLQISLYRQENIIHSLYPALQDQKRKEKAVIISTIIICALVLFSVSARADGMPSWAQDFFDGSEGLSWTAITWNWCMGIVVLLLGAPPPFEAGGQFSEVWNFISNGIYPYFMGAGLALLNIFWFIGFCRQASNLRENVTMEIWIEHIIKVIITNCLIVFGRDLMQQIFRVTQTMTLYVFQTSEDYTIVVVNDDIGMQILSVLFSVIIFFVAIYCGIKLIVEVLSIYMNMFILTAIAPLALSTLSGGRGLESSAFSWMKAFLATCLQFVILGLVITIGIMMVRSPVFNDLPTDLWFFADNGPVSAMIVMVLMVSAAKGSETVVKRAFGLN